MRFQRSTGLLIALAAAVALAACATASPPTQLMAETRARIQTAKELGAEQDPRARMYLQLASEESARGEHLLATGENDAAKLQLERAGDDAALALATAKERRTAAEARDAIERAAELQRELGRMPSGKEAR